MEILEDRRLLATCHVVRLGDFGAGADLGGGHSRGDLRYCINKANDEPGPDTILLQVNGTINLAGPLTDLASDIEIIGPGSGLLTIRRDTGGDYRVITVAGDSATISGVSISNGRADVGGGIYNQGTLTLTDVVVTSNTSTGGFGGGIYNANLMTIDASAITDNTSTGPCTVYGGGITNAGIMSVSFSTISGNLATPGASGQFCHVAIGGGIDNPGTLTVDGSTITANTAFSPPIDMVFDDARGGAISLRGGTAVITNSTVATNTTSAGDIALGGGIYVAGTSASLTITHSTIAGNASVSDHVTNGGGISGDVTEMRNSILANNAASDGGTDLDGTLQSSGYNVIGDSSGGSGYAPTDLLDVDPLLGSLQDNGGPTETMALAPSSPAMDAGDSNPVNPPDWDQRGPGFPRIVNGRIDIGAFEVQASAGGFVPGPTFTTSPGAHVVANDLNSDGDPDLVITDSSYANVRLGTTGSDFQSPVSYYGGNGGQVSVVVDADIDGNDDLAIIGNIFIGVRKGKGDGTFKTAPQVTSLSDDAEVADFNGDSILDIVSAGYGQHVRIHFGNGDGTFQPSVSLGVTSCEDPVVADFDLNGVLDFAVFPRFDNKIIVFLGVGGGLFAPPVSYDFPNGFNHDMSAGDFDNDGFFDLALVASTPNKLFVFRNQGDGSFVLNQSIQPSYPNAVESKDFNGDGFDDIAVVGPSLEVFLSNGDSTFKLAMTADVGTVTSIKAVDLTADGVLDLVLGTNQPYILVLKGNGDGTFQFPFHSYATLEDNSLVTVGDWDGDGKLDIATGELVVTVYRGNGDGTFVNLGYYLPNGQSGNENTVNGDFDGDGDLDLLIGGSMFVNVGTGFDASRAYLSGLSSNDDLRTVTTGDFNGDGRMDFAVGSFGVPPSYSGSATVFLSNDDGSFAQAARFSTGTPTAVAVADLNGDGALDLVATKLGAGTVSVILGNGNGNGTFQPPADVNAGSLPYGITVGDFDGDSHTDLAVAVWDPSYPPGPGTVRILFGNGDGSFESPIDYQVDSNPFSVITADFNGDGILDLATANEGSNTASVLIGWGDGTFFPASHYGVAAYPQSLLAADFNGDGLPDLAVQSGRVTSSGGTLSILINTGSWPPLPIGGGPNPATHVAPNSRPFLSPMANCPNDDSESFKTVRSRVTAQNPPVAVDVSCSPPTLPARARIRAQNRSASDIAAKSAVDAMLGNLF